MDLARSLGQPEELSSEGSKGSALVPSLAYWYSGWFGSGRLRCLVFWTDYGNTLPARSQANGFAAARALNIRNHPLTAPPVLPEDLPELPKISYSLKEFNRSGQFRAKHPSKIRVRVENSLEPRPKTQLLSTQRYFLVPSLSGSSSGTRFSMTYRESGVQRALDGSSLKSSLVFSR